MRTIALLVLLQADGAPNREPELVGRVMAAVPDGPATMLTLRLSGGTIQKRPDEFFLYITPASKVAYVEVPLGDRRPSVGMMVQAWLKEGGADQAAFARFALDEKSLPKPPPPPPPPIPVNPPPPPVPLAAAVTLEAEEMNLREVVVKELAGASQGKAIFFEKPGSRAKATVKLGKGTWAVRLDMQGRTTVHDAVVLRLAGREYRIYQDQWGKLAAGRVRDLPRLLVDVPGDGDYELRLEFAETDVYVDRVVLAPARRPDTEGAIRHWLVLGAIPGPEGEKELDLATLPNEASLRPREGEKVSVRGRELTWRSWESREATVNFHEVAGKETPDAVAYAACVLVADEELKDLELCLGGEDACKVWLNGAEVAARRGKAAAQKEPTRVKSVTLRRGENVLVLKVVNEKLFWRAGLRFTRADGRPLTELSVVSGK